MSFIWIALSCNSKKTKDAKGHTLNSKPHSSSKKVTAFYLGNIFGEGYEKFKKQKDDRLDSTFSRNSIMESGHPLDIRFFVHNDWSDTGYCITVFFDTSFHGSIIKHFLIYDTTSKERRLRQAENAVYPIKGSIDSIVNRLVQNGVFSLDNVDTLGFNSFRPRQLRNGKIEDKDVVTHVQLFDGVRFVLEYKVDSVFRRIYFGDPSMNYRDYPDFQPYRRKYEIISILSNILNKNN